MEREQRACAQVVISTGGRSLLLCYVGLLGAGPTNTGTNNTNADAYANLSAGYSCAWSTIYIQKYSLEAIKKGNVPHRLEMK